MRQVIAEDGILATEARLQLARALIESAPLEALKVLKPLLDPKSSSPAKLDALVLAAEAHRAMGGENHYRQAVAIYDQVLADPSLPYGFSNRFHSLRGQAYELLQEPEKALASYLAVLHRENLPENHREAEWEWFNDCGFNALRLQEARERWKAAYKTAMRLASNPDNPRAQEALDRAEGIQLEHMIWEEQ